MKDQLDRDMETFRRLCKKYGLTYKLRGRLRLTGMPRKKHQRLQEWEREAIAQAYLAGEKLAAIALEFEVLESTVSRIAEARGYPRRTDRGPLSAKPSAKPRELSFREWRKMLANQRRVNLERRRLAQLRKSIIDCG